MIQFQYLARNRIAAVRLNGHEIPRTRRSDADRLEEIGQFTIRGGLGHKVFVRGLNSLEVDVDDAGGTDGPPLLRIRHEESAVYIPRHDAGRAAGP